MSASPGDAWWLGRIGRTMLWAITSYFNPANFESRLTNYRAFRRRLRAPLAAVELSFGGSFALRQGDADILVQIPGGDVLWQKERLLNLALEVLPAECDAVAWLDCDIVFEREDWVEATMRALGTAALVQIFHERHDLPRGADLDRLAPAAHPYAALAWKWATGAATVEDMVTAAAMTRRTAGGLAWACHREILSEHGLYDACILGGGDRPIMYAALGEFDWTRRALQLNRRSAAHYRKWAGPFHKAARGRVSCVPGRLYHLWHGERVFRAYAERKRILTSFDFDPGSDIRIDGHGCWRWASAKPRLHARVRNYFTSRREDG